MANQAQIGIVGCGNISEAYLRLASVFRNVRIVAVADIVPAAARGARRAVFGARHDGRRTPEG
jgi:predicted dehydrogenase